MLFAYFGPSKLYVSGVMWHLTWKLLLSNEVQFPDNLLHILELFDGLIQDLDTLLVVKHKGMEM